MYNKLTFWAVACISLIAVAQAATSNTTPPPPPPPPCGCTANLTACCPSLPVIVNETALKACKLPPPGTTPPPAGTNPPPPPPCSCVMQCAFNASGFLTKDSIPKVNLTALNLQLNKTPAPWLNIMTAAQANCTTSIPTITSGSNCTSGACEIYTCLTKYLMLNCTDAVKSDTCSKVIAGIDDMCKQPPPERTK